MILRDYQVRSREMLMDWFKANKEGHPVMVLPTGSGKSVIIADFIKHVMTQWSERNFRILMLCHQKELIEQNAAKMRHFWPNAPMGIYSASVGKRQMGEPITFAGIQSVWKRADAIGHIDLCLVDECHAIGATEQGRYRHLLDALLAINPKMRIIGYSATPYRLGHGMITDKPAIFDALIEPIKVEELIYQGYLSVLRSKMTIKRLDVSGVKKSHGEYVNNALQAAVNTPENNDAIVREIIKYGADRRSWLIFCTGITHAQNITDCLIQQGITAACVTGETSKTERETLLADFKAGRIKAMTNYAVLTTGFDAPEIDLIAMLRPTMSPGLYVQMAGRGMRIAENKHDCLVLDFAGVVAMHGPITAVQPPRRSGSGDGETPFKLCEECNEICKISDKECPACGWMFPPPKPKTLELHNDDIMGIDGVEMEVTGWHWKHHISKSSGMEMLAVTYYGHLSDAPVTEYLTVTHENYAGKRARNLLISMANKAGVSLADAHDIFSTADAMNTGEPPFMIEHKLDGKFTRIIGREWIERRPGTSQAGAMVQAHA